MSMGRKKFICHSELPYHVTARCINREWFAPDMKTVWHSMTQQLYFVSLAYGIRIQAFVLMSNHFHMIVKAPNGNLSEAMKFFMSETGRDLRGCSGRINRIYGSRFHRSLIDSPLYFHHAYKYVYRNPVEAGLIAKVEDYPYSTLPGLLGKSRIAVPILDDLNWGSYAERIENLDWLNRPPEKGQWQEVHNALKKGVFKLARQNSRPSKLENDAL